MLPWRIKIHEYKKVHGGVKVSGFQIGLMSNIFNLGYKPACDTEPEIYPERFNNKHSQPK